MTNLDTKALEAALVKPLEWRLLNSFGDLRGWGIETALYAISNVDIGGKVKWHLSSFVREIGHFDTPDEAKAAAQADYADRILSALDLSAASPRSTILEEALIKIEGAMRFYAIDMKQHTYPDLLTAINEGARLAKETVSHG